MYIIKEGDIDTVYDEGHPGVFVDLGTSKVLCRDQNGVAWGVCMRIMSREDTQDLAQTTAPHLPF